MNTYVVLERLLGGKFAYICEFDAADSREAGWAMRNNLKKDNKTGLFDLLDKRDLDFGETKLDKPFGSLDFYYFGEYGRSTSDIPDGFWTRI